MAGRWHKKLRSLRERISWNWERKGGWRFWWFPVAVVFIVVFVLLFFALGEAGCFNRAGYRTTRWIDQRIEGIDRTDSRRD